MIIIHFISDELIGIVDYRYTVIHARRQEQQSWVVAPVGNDPDHLTFDRNAQLLHSWNEHCEMLLLLYGEFPHNVKVAKIPDDLEQLQKQTPPKGILRARFFTFIKAHRLIRFFYGHRHSQQLIYTQDFDAPQPHIPLHPAPPN